MVTKETLIKFKNLYKAKFNTDLSDEEATQMATDLINLMKVLTKPEPKENNNDIYKEEGRTDQDETISVYAP
ncbi:MAG TPA: hypothetical protein VLF89_00240 [Candidatus Saccharimonadales bacterium]|nr:hypothetical protein [Candidatus Saccharimonadales bacterium]